MEIINKRYVEECPLSALKPHPRNPREGDIGAISQSIEHNGFYGACIVQESTGRILAGNHRFQAAAANGADSVPVIFVDVDDDTALKILLADNRTNDLASYNKHELAELLTSIQSEHGTLDGTGYDTEALQELLEDLTNAHLALNDGMSETESESNTDGKEGNTPDDETPEVPTVPVARPGDIWICGDHRIMCGDSTSKDEVAKLLDGQLADMVFTDPPYNVDYDPEARPNGPTSKERKKKPLGKIQGDKKTPEEFRAFLDAIYSSLDSGLKAGHALYICHADTEGHHFRNAFKAQPWKLQSCLIWKKTVLVFGRSDYHWMHEPILYGWKEGKAHVWAGDRKQTTIIEVPTEHHDKGSSDTNGKYVHPTQKPVKLILIAIVNSSSQQELVLDLFGGSGSTMIAAEKLSRRSRLMEIDPRFVDVIVKRWQNFTGRKATLENDGRCFEDIELARVTGG